MHRIVPPYGFLRYPDFKSVVFGKLKNPLHPTVPIMQQDSVFRQVF